MPIKFVDRHMSGFMPILEASEGVLSCGRKISSGPVFDKFSDAFVCMNAWLENNRRASTKVKVAKVVEFEGMVSCAVHVPDGNR